MFIDTKELFTETKDILTFAGPTTPGRPFLNEIQRGALSTSSTFLADKRTLMNWIKRTPEAIGILRQLSLDIITRINFVAMESKNKGGRPKKNSGEEAERRAEKFVKDNLLKQQLRAAVIEWLALGDAYLWESNTKIDKIKEIIKKVYKEYGLETKELDLEKKAIDEDYVGQKKLQYVAAATMYIELDQSGTKIKSFIQRPVSGFGNNTFPTSATGLPSNPQAGLVSAGRRWSPDQIIHFKFMELDGKVHGFTPMQSCFPIIKTLGAIKDYHGHYFESGELADIIFNYEEIDNHVELAKMQQLVQEWYNNRRRSHLVTSGKFKIEKINEWNKDMEFRMLAIYYTGVIAFSVGMPLEKIRAILGGEIKSSTGASDISKTDYINNVFDMQDDWELILNTQFFNDEFGVNLRFQRTSARDEHAEAMRDEIKLNVTQKLFDMDIINKKDRVEYLAKEFPDIPRGWINPNPKPEMSMNSPFSPSSKAFPNSQGKNAVSQEKKNQQKPQAKNNPPTGL